MLKRLESFGFDIENARHRFLDDDDFYKESILSLARDPEFKILDDALREKRYEDAFRSAHNLKGVTLTLGAVPLSDPISRVVEDLRDGPTSSLEKDYEDFLCAADIFHRLMEV
ncbi:MAG: Hpt domain-containing protein [Lachnospiraceae bacterium]|nr:Hpt domain-containing protein [Lachnospiraceae bacterium]